MRVLILAGITRSFFMRRELIQEMIKRGHDVIGCAPEEDTDGICDELGMRFIQIKYRRASVSVIEDVKIWKEYVKLLRAIKPDLIFCYSIKPNIYGAFAAKKVGIKCVHLLITGLGNAFIDNGSLKRKIIKYIVKLMYKRAFRIAQTVTFQNPDDKAYMEEIKLVSANKAYLVNGSGVNMEYFGALRLPEKPVFLMISRLLREKGVCEYCEAARAVKDRYPDIIFLLLGSYEESGFALKEEDIAPYVKNGTVTMLSETKDVRPCYAQASVVVLPSYREGTPRTILEAAACGRAVITTDVPGCRETVLHQKTGLLVPAKNSAALAEAMVFMIENHDKVEQMGLAGHEYCRDRYEITKVNTSMLNIMGL